MTTADEMPPPGTMKICWFCHMVVTLRTTPSGWHHWLAAADPIDERRRCDGGVPGTRDDPALYTLHVPAPLLDEITGKELQTWWPRYTPDGLGRGPTEAPSRRTA